jgi:hypothetical protein
MEVSGQLHAPAVLLKGKSPRYPLDRRLDGPQNRSGHGGENKNTNPNRLSNFKEQYRLDQTVDNISDL